MARITQLAVATVKVKRGTMGGGAQLEEERVELFALDDEGRVRRCILPPNEKPGAWLPVNIPGEAAERPAPVMELMRGGIRR